MYGYTMVWYEFHIFNTMSETIFKSLPDLASLCYTPGLTELFHPQVNAPSDSPSQFFPVQISVQAQKYPPWELVQVPPCSHGGFRHSLVSINRETTKWLHTSPVL